MLVALGGVLFAAIGLSSQSFDPGDIRGVGQVDPCFPADRIALPPEEWARWLPTRIGQLAAEQAQLRKAISGLPRHHPIPLFSRLGYHSRIVEAGSADGLSLQQIQVTWPGGPRIDSIALAPAFNPKAPGAYAFPKRFKIEMLNADTREFETVVDWTDEDFPDPGMYPVFFAGINRRGRKMRITMPQVTCESGLAYSALGEVYVLRQRGDGSMGANIVGWGHGEVEVDALESFSMKPLWDLEYLHDGLTGLGFPLSDETVGSRDLMVLFGTEDSPDEVQVLLDLGRKQKIGRVDFWPTAPPAGLALPSFGFPRNITLQLSPDPDFKNVKVLTRQINDNTHREHLFSLATREFEAQYLRIIMRGLAEHEGQRILGFGEILVSMGDRALSTGCKVTAEGIPEDYLEQLPLLVDGCSRHRRILPVGEWIKGLAQRRPLDRRLAVVDRELALARSEWQHVQRRFGTWAGGAAIAVLVAGLVVQWRIRRRAIEKLRWSIARDLHDDVGSSLGSISLAAEQLKHAGVDAGAREDLCDLSLMAREAWASLRDVVWIVDETTIRLPVLVSKLRERTERVLAGVEVTASVSEDLPDSVVSLPSKRHLIMCCKEVLHNCARHAQATQVWLDVSLDGKRLRISFRDNGRGFDPAAASAGLGLESMRKRAAEMGGTMTLDAQPGEGVSLVFTIPLAALERKASPSYRTSN